MHRCGIRAFDGLGEVPLPRFEALRRAQEIGTFDKDRDPNAVAALIQCGMQGMTLLAKSKPGDAMINGVVNELLRALD